MVSAKTASMKKVAKKASKPASKQVPGKVAKKAARKSATPSSVAAPEPTRVVTKTGAEAPVPHVAAPAPVVEKHKLVRDSFTMPKHEYELLEVLKGRLMLMSRATKKSELLRAGVVTLAQFADAQLLVAVSRVPSLKTGRPKKTRDAVKATKKKP